MIQAIQRSRSFPSTSFPRATPRIDAIRVFGYSSALAANLIAAGLLLMPLQMPPPLAPPEPRPVWILPAKPMPPVLPPPVQEARPPTETPRIELPARPVADPPAEAPVIIFEEGSLPTMAPIEVFVSPSIEAPSATTGPAPAQLEYAVAPPPPYPRERLRNGDEGIVVLQVLVDVDGTPLDVEIVESSGHRELDQAARRHVLANWTFRPAMRDGIAVQAIGLVPIEFTLD